jgi:hypothetical protein
VQGEKGLMFSLTKQLERYLLPISYTAFLLLVMRAFPLGIELKIALGLGIFVISLVIMFVIRRGLEEFFIKTFFFFLAFLVNPVYPPKFRPEGAFLVDVVYACMIMPITLYYIWMLKREKE